MKIRGLRVLMASHGLDAYIVPSGDAHSSEYVAPCDERRAWLTGFTGSAGTAIVSMKEAALWTDGRYFNQASTQLEGSPFPNKAALSVTAWKALEDSIELVTQVAYIVTFQEADSFVLMNLGFTLLMMLYDVIGKYLRYACVPDPELEMVSILSDLEYFPAHLEVLRALHLLHELIHK